MALLSLGLTAFSLLATKEAAKKRFKPTGTINRGARGEAFLGRSTESILDRSIPENLTARFKTDTKRALQARGRLAKQSFRATASPDRAVSGRAFRRFTDENIARLGLSQRAAQQTESAQEQAGQAQLGGLQKTSDLFSAQSTLRNRADLLRSEIHQAGGAELGRTAAAGVNLFALEQARKKA